MNGFIFVDAPISPTPMQTWDFEQMAREVQQRRALNSRFNLTTDLALIRVEVDQQNAMRMLSIRGAESYITHEGGGPSPNRLAPRSQRVAEPAGGGVKRTISGVGVLRDWLGDGAVPVENERAQMRAEICAQCPQNAKGDWTSFFTTPVAALIRQQLSIRNDLNLTTTQDAQLNVCEACGCPLKLKVHVPLAHITNHLSDGVRAKLDSRCWITDEMQPKKPDHEPMPLSPPQATG